jgi:MIP family channel proteins
MLGTYLLVFLGPASVVVVSLIPSLTALESRAFIALAFGCIVACVIVLLGRFSGAHINPAISLAFSFAGTFRRRLFLPYVASQLTGGLLAGLSLKVVFGSIASSADLGSTKLAAGITPVEGIALEAVGTFLLSLTVLLVAHSVRNSVEQAILVGTTLFILISIFAPLTGASFNPARSLGPSLFSGYFANQAVYWVGPLLGAACAGLIFRALEKTRGRYERLGAVRVR